MSLLRLPARILAFVFGVFLQMHVAGAATQYLNVDLHTPPGNAADALVLSFAIDNTTSSGNFSTSSLVFGNSYLLGYSGSPASCTTCIGTTPFQISNVGVGTATVGGVIGTYNSGGGCGTSTQYCLSGNGWGFGFEANGILYWVESSGNEKWDVHAATRTGSAGSYVYTRTDPTPLNTATLNNMGAYCAGTTTLQGCTLQNSPLSNAVPEINGSALRLGGLLLLSLFLLSRKSATG
jgi:hypothetical protein